MKLIIDSPNNIIKIASRMPDGDQWSWCYFGVYMNKKQEISSSLPASRRYYYAEELNQIAHEMKTPFLDWMSEINSDYKDNLRWWAKPLPSKSVFQTDFFLLLCYFNLIKKWAKEKSNIDLTLLIAVEDPFLLKMLKTSLRNINGVRVGGLQLRLLRSKIISFIKMVVAKERFILKWVRILLSDIALKIRYPEKYCSMTGLKPDILTYTWVEERCFNQDDFQDVYLGDLRSIYRKNNFKVMVTTPVWLSRKLKKRVIRLKEDMIVISFFLKFTDCLKATLNIPQKYPKGTKMIFRGDDYSPLFEREYLAEIRSLPYMFNLLEYYAYRNYFIKQWSVRLFVYPFENQPWEKMVLMAIKSSGLVAVTAGYQHSSIASLLLNYFLGKNESKSMPLPDNIITNGSYHEGLLSKANYGRVNIINGGSLRYKDRELSGVRREKVGAVIKYMLLLPGAMNRALEMIYDLKWVAGKSGHEIIVRPHPDLPTEKIKGIIREISDDIKIDINKNLAESLMEMDAVVHAGSTAALEACYMGLKVFKYMTEFIDVDILADIKVDQIKIKNMAEIISEGKNIFIANKVPEVNIIGEEIKEDAWLSLLSKN